MKYLCRAGFKWKLADESAETPRPGLTSGQKGRMCGSNGSRAGCEE